jgi:biotin carboxyl carrier protein
MAMTARRPVRVTLDGRSQDLAGELAAAELEPAGQGTGHLRTPEGRAAVLWEGHPHAQIDGRVELEVVVDGWRFTVSVELLEQAALREKARRGAAAAGVHGPFTVRAPIPGRIGTVRVTDGQTVEEGAGLLTLEAMKMENVVRAPRAGTIARVAVAAGQTVELGDALVELA